VIEQEWLESENPGSLVRFLLSAPSVARHRRSITDRKLRLLMVAFARRLHSPWGGSAVEMSLIAEAERNADGVEGAELPATGDDTAEALACHSRPGWAVLQVLRHLPVDGGETLKQARLMRDVLGNPFRSVSVPSAWRTPTVVALARVAYEDRFMQEGTLKPAHLAILSDALEEAGCDNVEVLSHLRGPAAHVRGCWVVDQLLEKSSEKTPTS
jgi:hypothetical protein